MSLTNGNCYRVLTISEIGWKNLINPVSEASPVVGMSIYNLVLSSLSHLIFSSLIFYSLSFGLNAVLLLIAFTLSEGKDRSKLATEQITAASCNA